MPAGPARVRFAPSPTGFFHVGGARTALFNWVVARQTGGALVLRIEDTDVERSRDEWIEGILAALRWLGIDWDEGPVLQSRRGARYGEAAEALWAAGLLYACDCKHDQVEARNRAAGRLTPGYDGFCRDRGLPRATGNALRFRTPDEGTTVVEDVVRGEVVFPNEAIDDFVAVKGDGSPLFVLANVVDDIDMAITHVIRGEDLLPTTPKGILLWGGLAATGWRSVSLDTDRSEGPVSPLPRFAHLPMLVNEQRKKLSKRRDPVAVESYRDQGYISDAVVNYLGLLGWSPPGGEEVFGRDQMVDWFRLEDVNHAPAFFDVAKLTHLNGEYVRAMPTADFVDACGPWVTGAAAPWPSDRFDPDVFRSIAPVVQERVAVLSEVPAMVDFLFLDEPVVDAASFDKVVAGDPAGRDILALAVATYEGLEVWDRDSLYEATASVGESVGLKLAKAQAPIRVAVTGRRVGPPLFESLALLGRARTLRRLRAALERAAGERGSEAGDEAGTGATSGPDAAEGSNSAGGPVAAGGPDGERR